VCPAGCRWPDDLDQPRQEADTDRYFGRADVWVKKAKLKVTVLRPIMRWEIIVDRLELNKQVVRQHFEALNDTNHELLDKIHHPRGRNDDQPKVRYDRPSREVGDGST
jgi:hypothetical protein